MHPLHKILNRNTVKLSYSCTKNIKSIMQAHNTKLLTGKEEEEGQQKTCNCQRSRKEKCPLKGECIQKDAIYHATIKTEKEERKYVGSTVNFKRRYISKERPLLFHTFSLSLPNDELALETLRLISSSMVAESDITLSR